jgi:hypothetical protein
MLLPILTIVHLLTFCTITMTSLAFPKHFLTMACLWGIAAFAGIGRLHLGDETALLTIMAYMSIVMGILNLAVCVLNAWFVPPTASEESSND